VRGPHLVELCFTPTSASWANPIEAHFGPLRQFTLANSDHPNHTAQARAHHGMTLQEAIDAPAFHTTHVPSSFAPRASSPGEVVVEDRLSPGVVQELERRGHQVTRSAPWSLGRLSGASPDPETGFLIAGANPRGDQGYAAGR
jgi:gamma-glutamyltranspeptidase